MKQEKMNQYEQIVWNYLQEFAAKDPAFAEKLANPKKDIHKCLAYITQEARKQAKGSMAMVEDKVVFGWAVHYYDEENLESETVKRTAVVSKPKASTTKSGAKSNETSEAVQVTTADAKTPQIAQNAPEQAPKPTPLHRTSKPKAANIYQLSLFDL